MSFTLLGRDPASRGRLGELRLRHATVSTPVFMPVGTLATVKALEPEDIRELGFRLSLVNAYHLWQRPGLDVLRVFDGVHRFMNWDGAVLSDSGGFQVFSLRSLGKITEEGAAFRSHLDGRPLFLTPEVSAEIQVAIDSDVVMAFDECAPYPCDESYVAEAMRRSARWTERSLRWFRANGRAENLFFGIVQGGMVAKLRAESADRVTGLACDGYAVGGLSVGEPRDLMVEVLEASTALLPEDRPRYLMGVGTPLDIIDAVVQGVDMFDCVYPTRMARHGVAFARTGKIRLRNAAHRLDDGPLDPECACSTCRSYSRAYVHHLFRSRELTAWTLVSRHNLAVYARLMSEIRAALPTGSMAQLREAWAGWNEEGTER